MEENNVFEQEQTQIEPKKNGNKGLSITWIVLLAIAGALFLIITVPNIFEAIRYSKDTSENAGLGFGFWLAFILIIFSGIGYAIDLIISIVGLIISIANFKKGGKKYPIFIFIALIVLIIATYFAMIFICSKIDVPGASSMLNQIAL